MCPMSTGCKSPQSASPRRSSSMMSRRSNAGDVRKVVIIGFAAVAQHFADADNIVFFDGSQLFSRPETGASETRSEPGNCSCIDDAVPRSHRGSGSTHSSGRFDLYFPQLQICRRQAEAHIIIHSLPISIQVVRKLLARRSVLRASEKRPVFPHPKDLSIPVE